LFSTNSIVGQIKNQGLRFALAIKELQLVFKTRRRLNLLGTN
jgi:hypothetical protein